MFHTRFPYPAGALIGNGGWIADPFTPSVCVMQSEGNVVQTIAVPSYARQPTAIAGLVDKDNFTASITYTINDTAHGDGYLILGDVATTFTALYWDLDAGLLQVIDSAGGAVGPSHVFTLGRHVMTVRVEDGETYLYYDGLLIAESPAGIDWSLTTLPFISIELENAAVGATTINAIDIDQ